MFSWIAKVTRKIKLFRHFFLFKKNKIRQYFLNSLKATFLIQHFHRRVNIFKVMIFLISQMHTKYMNKCSYHIFIKNFINFINCFYAFFLTLVHTWAIRVCLCSWKIIIQKLKQNYKNEKKKRRNIKVLYIFFVIQSYIYV